MQEAARSPGSHIQDGSTENLMSNLASSSGHQSGIKAKIVRLHHSPFGYGDLLSPTTA